jgi:hypothetical protein
MGTSGEIDGIMRRTRGSWYEDGLADITLGGYALVVGLMLTAQAYTPAGSALWAIWSVAAPIVLLLGGAAAGWVLRRIKVRLVNPRGGYVEFERRGASGLPRIIWTVLLGAAVAAMAVVVSGKLANLSLIFGVTLCAAFTYIWQRVGLKRYLILAGWSLAAGAAIVPLPLSMDLGGAFFWVLAGGGLLLSGLVAWRRFDREAPAREESDEAHL